MTLPRRVTRHLPAADREPTTGLPIAVRLNTSDEPDDVVDALLLAAFTSGEQPFARTTRLDRPKADVTLLPPGARLTRVATDDNQELRLAVGDGWTVRVTRWRDSAEVTVTAVTEETAKTVLEAATKDAVEEPPPDDGTVTMGFWYHSSRRGAYRTTRPITTTQWSQIRRNYSAPVATAFDQLMAIEPTPDTAELNGRLVLLYGPPGTGKTTALRTLARHWRKWCQVDCILDPEQLFHDPSYLMEVAVAQGDDDDDDTPRKWRLLLLEDCDELIRGEAKQSSGQALSRLLNLTDGLLGQGRNVLLGLTTNERIDQLHPAVVRPGRCLAKIEVSSLTQDEARDWLDGDDNVGPDGATLAELYARHGGRQPVTSDAPEPAYGLYL